MKKSFFLVLIACFYLACTTSSTRTIPKTEKDSNELALSDNEVAPENQLESYLNRVAGVSVIGSGQNAKVQVRGVNSFSGNTEPLFLINGTDVGSSYANAANLLRGMKIQSVKVLKGSDASLYGVRGAGGVIIIKAK